VICFTGRACTCSICARHWCRVDHPAPGVRAVTRGRRWTDGRVYSSNGRCRPTAVLILRCWSCESDVVATGGDFHHAQRR